MRRGLSRITAALLLLPTLGSAQTEAECVVLLHGLARSSASMRPMAAALEDRGYRIANIDYPSREQPIERLAPLAVGEGLAQCRAQSATAIHFVTHSLGGILVRAYLGEHAVPELGRVVMLGPPNQGSEVVDQFAGVPGFEALNGPAGGQLGTGPNSVPLKLGRVDFTLGVIAGTQSINPILSTAFNGPNDGKVSVSRARVAGMSDFIALPVSHPFLMRDDAVIRQTLQFLHSGRFLSEAPAATADSTASRLPVEDTATSALPATGGGPP
ncbi:MAG: alpha/beta fold hydrolase [Xanthomonadales bacterium]|jgi:pimeloyl-ACP methyl ester carboxylesterase|nr:alpha/beta fold hydrolase [Xanthomonadales bacterium]